MTTSTYDWTTSINCHQCFFGTFWGQYPNFLEIFPKLPEKISQCKMIKKTCMILYLDFFFYIMLCIFFLQLTTLVFISCLHYLDALYTFLSKLLVNVWLIEIRIFQISCFVANFPYSKGPGPSLKVLKKNLVMYVQLEMIFLKFYAEYMCYNWAFIYLFEYCNLVSKKILCGFRGTCQWVTW